MLTAIKNIWPLVLYYFYLVISLSWSLYLEHSAYYVFNHGIFVCASIFSALLIKHHGAKRAVKFFQFSAYVALVLTVVDFFTFSALEMTRLGSGGSTAFLYGALPFMMIAESKKTAYKYVPVLIALLLLSVSASRTTLMCGLIGVLLTVLWTEKKMVLRIKRMAQLSFVGFLMTLIVFAIPPLRLFLLKLFVRVTGIDLSYYSSFLEAEGQDYKRVLLWDEATYIYQEFWFEGMGYLGFKRWFGEVYNYEFEDQFGNTIFGYNLHNSFLTWALEGGIFCVIIVAIMFLTYLRRSFKMIKVSDDHFSKSFYKVCIISLLTMSLYGLFHQLHQGFLFYVMLGIVFGSSPAFQKTADVMRS